MTGRRSLRHGADNQRPKPACCELKLFYYTHNSLSLLSDYRTIAGAPLSPAPPRHSRHPLYLPLAPSATLQITDYHLLLVNKTPFAFKHI